MKNLIQAQLILIFLLLFLFNGHTQQLTWTEVAPGVWKGSVGKPESYDLIKASGSVPNREALSKMEKTVFPLSKPDIAATVSDGKTYLRFPLEKEEQLFGFGLNFQTVHQRGKILQLHVDHYGGKDNGRTHAPHPFMFLQKDMVYLSILHDISMCMPEQAFGKTVRIHRRKRPQYR